VLAAGNGSVGGGAPPVLYAPRAKGALLGAAAAAARVGADGGKPALPAFAAAAARVPGDVKAAARVKLTGLAARMRSVEEAHAALPPAV